MGDGPTGDGPATASGDFRREHQDVWELLPWHVNGTLEDAEAAKVDRHLDCCLTCRSELAQQRDLARHIRDSDAIDGVLEASLAKMHARIAEDEHGSRHAAAPRRLVDRWLSAALRPFRESPRLVRSLVAVQAIAIAVMVVALSVARPVPSIDSARYGTLAQENGPLQREALRVIFDPTAEERALRNLLAAGGLRIVDGPSPTGVYTLSVPAGDGDTVDAELARLQSSALVDFVTRVAPVPDEAG